MSKIELLKSITDFYKTKTKYELVIYIVLPIMISSLIWIVSALVQCPMGFSYGDFISDFINTVITVMALFISFSMAYLTILISSDSENVKILKKRTSENYTLDKKPVFLFQLLMIDITYNVLIEIILLLVAFFEKFLVIISNDFSIKIYLTINVLLFIHIIFILLRNLKNMYFSFWKAQ